MRFVALASTEAGKHARRHTCTQQLNGLNGRLPIVGLECLDAYRACTECTSRTKCAVDGRCRKKRTYNETLPRSMRCKRQADDTTSTVVKCRDNNTYASQIHMQCRIDAPIFPHGDYYSKWAAIRGERVTISGVNTSLTKRLTSHQAETAGCRREGPPGRDIYNIAQRCLRFTKFRDTAGGMAPQQRPKTGQ